MTEVEFHVNLPDRLQYACRLLRKAYRKGVRVAVTGSPSVLTEMDRQLWACEPEGFLPHVYLEDKPVAVSKLQHSAVWLVSDASRATELPVLVNLGEQVCETFESFGRLIELVGDAEVDRDAGRLRWKQYVARGYTPRKHEAAV
jgi:DNA polymerase-3 subunit chi